MMKNVTVFFDEENQQDKIILIKNWKLNYPITYIGFTIKAKKEIFDLSIIKETMLFVVLIGESTKFLSKEFIDCLELITKSTNAILCFNLNGIIGINEDECPRVLWDCGAIHMPFDKENVSYSLNTIKLNTRKDKNKGSFHFRKDIRPWDME